MANATEIHRRARYAVESYRSIYEWETPEEYLAAFTEAMDDLCEAVGLEPPVIEGVFDG